jgi:hypothetical protein
MPDGSHSFNRHQRRRRAAEHRRYSIQDFHDDTAGVFSLEVVTPIDIAALMLTDSGIARSLMDWLARIEATRPLCATCDFVFTREVPPSLWLIAQAFGNPAARGLMLMGACEDCYVRYPNTEALVHAGAEALKRGAWPDLRVLDPVHFAPGGRA